MEKERHVKILSIIALIIAIVGMSLGFAAFSTTLNISSMASVTPSNNDFRVVFCNDYELGSCEDQTSDYPILCNAHNGAKCVGTVSDKDLELNDLKAEFTKPGQNVRYMFDIQNLGQYDAFLKAIRFDALSNGNYKKCSPATTDATKATDSLVQSACDGIRITISIDGEMYEPGMTNIIGHKLSKSTSQEVIFKIEYLQGSSLADGPFNVEIADFKFDYSSSEETSNIIEFTIDGEVYQAETGMTWEAWVNSSYNTISALIVDNVIYLEDPGETWGATFITDYDFKAQSPSDVIISNGQYTNYDGGW